MRASPYIARNRHAQDIRLNAPPPEPDPDCNHGLRRSDHMNIISFKHEPCLAGCDLGMVTCSTCEGHGGVTLPPAAPFFREEWHECRKCRGEGKVVKS
jgi:hypothetical protein